MDATTVIKLSFSYRNHLSQVNDYTLEFSSIPDFKNYLRWEPDKAMLIGYGNVDHERIKKSRTSNTIISISHRGHNFNFDTAKQFGDFLNQTPEIARLLQYRLH